MEYYFTGNFVEVQGNHEALYARSVKGSDTTVFWFKINDRNVPMGELKKGVRELGIVDPSDSIWSDPAPPEKYEPTELDKRYGTELSQIQRAYGESRIAELLQEYEGTYQDTTAIVWVIFDMNSKLRALNEIIANSDDLAAITQKVADLTIRIDEFQKTLDSASTLKTDIETTSKALTDLLAGFNTAILSTNSVLTELNVQVKTWIVDLKLETAKYMSEAASLNGAITSSADLIQTMTAVSKDIALLFDKIEDGLAKVDLHTTRLAELSIKINESIKFNNIVVDYSEVAENLANTLNGIKELIKKPKERI